MDSDGTTELAKLCGSSLPPIIISSGNKLTVVFHSDDTVTERGFLATWSKVPGATSGVITSPNFPNTYPKNASQVIMVYVPTGKKISLTITDLNIEVKVTGTVEACGYDRLKIFDSIESLSALLVSFKGRGEK